VLQLPRPMRNMQSAVLLANGKADMLQLQGQVLKM
jgi:hypothetical protein